jgi:hypothetical protein
VEILAHESAAKHRRTWQLADTVVDEVPECAAMIKRVSKSAPQKR